MRAARLVIAGAVLFVGTIIMMEGVSSLVLSGVEAVRHGEPGSTRAKRIWTHYDSVLGWASFPNVTIPNAFGPGVFVHTNALGFRGSPPTGARVPAGKVRVICAGDSFTFGDGVDDNHTWCQLLKSLDPRIEPVNMGQSGYGIDQAYLWYKRDGDVLRHDVLIFAFITDDFYRMETSTFSGFGKPTLDLDHGRLVVKNVPVRRRQRYASWPTRLSAIGHGVRQLSSYNLVLRTRQYLTRSRVTHDDTWPVAVKVFESLQEMNAAQKSALVLVYLPTGQDALSWTADKPYWRDRLAVESKKSGWTYIDLLADMRRLPAEDVERLFFEGGWHYTNAGNQWVASRLQPRIEALPPLQGDAPGSSSP